MGILSERAFVAILAMSLGSIAEAQTIRPLSIGQQATASPERLSAASNALPCQIRLVGSAIPLTDATLLLCGAVVSTLDLQKLVFRSEVLV